MLAVAVVGLGVFVAFWRLDVATFWVDEAAYASAGWAYMQGDFTPNPEHPPFAKYLFGLWGLAFGPDVISLRIFMGVVTLTTSAVIWWWMKHFIGPGWALLPAAMWLLMPRDFEGRARIDHLVSLDLVMVMLVILGFALAWRWSQTDQARYAILAGLAFGAAVMSKLPAAVFLPALLVLLVNRSKQPRPDTDLPKRCGSRGWKPWKLIWIFLLSMGGTCLLILLPFGPVPALRAMVSFQAAHNAVGHTILLNGHIYDFPPWWGALWFGATALGVAGTGALTLGCIGAMFKPQSPVVMLFAALILSLGFQIVVSRVLLPHYFIDWIWIPTILTGISVARLYPQHRGRVVSLLIICIVVCSSVMCIYSVASARKSGLARVPDVLSEYQTPGAKILVQGLSPAEDAGPYISSGVSDPTTPGITAIVVGHDPREPLDPAVRDLIANTPNQVSVIDLDTVDVYLLHGTIEFRDGRITISG